MLTLTEAAAQLGLDASSLRHQIRNGKLRARKVGRDWTVTEREVERYRRESRRGSAALGFSIGDKVTPLPPMAKAGLVGTVTRVTAERVSVQFTVTRQSFRHDQVASLP